MYRSRIPQITAKMIPVLEAAVTEAAQLVEDRAKQRVPVNTGRLRDAIHIEHTGLGEVTVVAGDTEAFYGHIVEHGGRYTPARPFLLPAGEESRDDAVKLVALALRSL